MTWAERTLEAVLDRARATEAAVGARWPLFADPETGEWTTTGRGSWTGGFWAGLLGLRATLGANTTDQALASSRTAALAPWIEADTATRGMIFWYGTGLAGQREMRDRAAQALIAAYDPALRVIPWGAAFGGPRDLARVDSLPGLLPLLAGAGEQGLRVMRDHLHRHLNLVTRGERPVPAWRATGGGTWVPHPDPPAGWSRTVPWLSLALADAAHADPLLLPRAHETLNHPAIAATPPAGDTSAAAIGAVALLKLARLADGREPARLRDQAARVLRGLVADHVRGGRLLGGCYDLHRGLATRHELVWGDFFLALGLAMITGAIDPFTC